MRIFEKQEISLKIWLQNASFYAFPLFSDIASLF